MQTRNGSMPIGVFDSGVGGLTVLKALQELLPQEDFIYLGDTARLPYGTKSRESIVRYALQSSRHLADQGIKLLVVACNTASASALPGLEAAYPGVPVVGVIKPGARAGCSLNRTGSPGGHRHGKHRTGRRLPTGHTGTLPPDARGSPGLFAVCIPGGRRLDQGTAGRNRSWPDI